ncbi:hypothetical protein LOK49_LG02G00926 [Camellia lanceoleosa]|uniref:Uncharacterized protein n=1 Tax=Camellia lanceoleosa TaxID=1840588 RepID=A0ACC0IT54_9ERIC|nr:hypothetical protein LOK49_LG02G00926 [Camellia lanceoleosa]
MTDIIVIGFQFILILTLPLIVVLFGLFLICEHQCSTVSVHSTLVDWKDNAAVVVCCPGNPSVDVWMIDNRCGSESNWCKKFVIGPVLGVEPFWLLQWTKNGEIMAADAWGRIFLYNPRNGEIKDIPIDGVQFEVFHYVESLVSIIGFRLQELNNQH